MTSENDKLEPEEFELELEPSIIDDGPAEDSEMFTNDYGATKDNTVVIEEEGRTVVLTDDETIIIEKDSDLAWDIAPSNRPRKVYTGMWGQSEIISVGLALMAVLAVLVLIIFFVFPAQNTLEENRAKRDNLEAQLKDMDKKYGSIQNTQDRVDDLINSVTDFETRFLKIPANGQTGLYQRLNGLISAYGLVNTSGPDYSPLEIVDPQGRQQTENESGRDKFLSLFPGVFATVTVEGSYQNLRGLIREIETSEQFIIISSVELVPADGAQEKGETAAVPVSADGKPGEAGLADIYKGKTQGQVVSLKLELVSYFRRPGFEPVGPEVAVR